MRIWIAAFVLGLLAASTFFALAPRPAAACSLVQLPLEQQAEIADLVIVGEVVHERVVRSGVYASTVDVAATLRGSSEPELTLDELGYLGADCSGGPRLVRGEKVLLFIDRGPFVELQVSGYEGGKYVLSETEAISAWQDAPIAVEDALRRVAGASNAPPDELDAALTFVRGETEPEPTPDVEAVPAGPDPDNGPSPLLIIGGAAAAAVLLAALFFVFRLLRRAS